MAIEEIGKDEDMETSYKDFANVSDAIKYKNTCKRAGKSKK